MMYWNGTGLSWVAATLMWVGMLAFWALVIWGTYLMLVGVSRRDGNTAPDRARGILDERLARGEIDTDEYRSRLDALTANHGAPTGIGSRR